MRDRSSVQNKKKKKKNAGTSRITSYRRNLVDDRYFSSRSTSIFYRRVTVSSGAGSETQESRSSLRIKGKRSYAAAGVGLTDIITWIEHASRAASFSQRSW